MNLSPIAQMNLNSSFVQNQEEPLKTTEFEDETRVISSNVSHNIRDGESLCSDSMEDQTSSEDSEYYDDDDEEEMEEFMNCRSKFTKMTVAQQSEHKSDLNCMRSNSMIMDGLASNLRGEFHYDNNELNAMSMDNDSIKNINL